MSGGSLLKLFDVCAHGDGMPGAPPQTDSMLEEVTSWGKILPHEVTSSIIEAACGGASGMPSKHKGHQHGLVSRRV